MYVWLCFSVDVHCLECVVQAVCIKAGVELHGMRSMGGKASGGEVFGFGEGEREKLAFLLLHPCANYKESWIRLCSGGWDCAKVLGVALRVERLAREWPRLDDNEAAANERPN